MSIEVKNLIKRFDEKTVIDNISFKVDSGEILAIVGFSGSGKSTVLKLICGLIDKDGGEIKTSGDIAMVFQYSALIDSVREKLALVGLSGVESKYPSELSGGMQKRVSFARAIVTEPNIILYDEPTAGLDPVSSTLIEDYIVRLKEETHAASIVVTHQMSTIMRTADKIIMLYNGKVVFTGTPQDLMRQDTPYTKQFVTASLEGPMKMLQG